MTNQNSSALPISFDCLQNGITAREHAAIQLRVPTSGTDWLDAMIRQSLRAEFAKTAMQACVGDEVLMESCGGDLVEIVGNAVGYADALLNELEKK